MEIRSIGVIGAGIMGNGIAQVCAVAGFDVVMVDVAEAAVARGKAAIGDSLGRLVAKEKLAAAERDAALARLTGTTSFEALAGVDLVIEAAREHEETKIAIFRQLGGILKADAIVATNTSSISITKLAAAAPRPDRLVGMHFFNPVPLMGLVELIRGLQTSDEALAAAECVVRAIGKTPIVVKNNPGFAVNRILVPMINEAIFALQEGLASAEQIDEGMKLGCNHPIGPLALADMIGLDTLLLVVEVFYEGFKDPKYRPAPLLKEMVDAGYLGRKSGRGFYSYA